jgi:hypothetical protein
MNLEKSINQSATSNLMKLSLQTREINEADFGFNCRNLGKLLLEAKLQLLVKGVPAGQVIEVYISF